MGLNAITPSLNWHLILLHTVGSAACLGLDLFATTRALRALSVNIKSQDC